MIAATIRGRVMRVVHVVSEVLPYCKTGGLADVAFALPREQAARGAQVALIAPLYAGVDRARHGLRREPLTLSVPLAGRQWQVGVWRGQPAAGVDAWLLEVPELFDRPGLYQDGDRDHPDNSLRFGLLCHAALELVVRARLKPDVLHAHDWQAGLVPFLARERFGGLVESVFTLHNLGYQGLFPAEVVPQLGLPWSVFTPEGAEYWGQFSFLKAGLVFAGRVTTVSRRYAQEIRTPEHGLGLEGVMQALGPRLVGILNGADYSEWDPRTDPLLAARYSPQDLSGKAACRAHLLREFGLEGVPPGRPVLGVVSRFVDQKGFDLLFQALDELLALDLVLVALGKGDRAYEQGFLARQQAHPDRLRVRVAYDNPLAHAIEAGADLFLMPSRYEPCGLNQIYSLRYGTPPVVRATGGLDDTVRDADRHADGNGFSFAAYQPRALLDAVGRALAAWAAPERYRAIQARGMLEDFSWPAPAQKYLDLYDELLQNGIPLR
jgi:starch synthase